METCSRPSIAGLLADQKERHITESVVASRHTQLWSEILDTHNMHPVLTGSSLPLAALHVLRLPGGRIAKPISCSAGGSATFETAASTPAPYKVSIVQLGCPKNVVEGTPSSQPWLPFTESPKTQGCLHLIMSLWQGAMVLLDVVSAVDGVRDLTVWLCTPCRRGAAGGSGKEWVRGNRADRTVRRGGGEYMCICRVGKD
jgi:hypothetical protein